MLDDYRMSLSWILEHLEVDAFVDSTQESREGKLSLMIRVGIVAQISHSKDGGKRAEGGEWRDGLMIRVGGDGEDYTKVSLKEQ